MELMRADDIKAILTAMATGFLKGGRAVAKKTEMTLKDLAGFMGAFVEGIIARGKAKPGEKTIIDSLLPAAEALLKPIIP